MTLIELYNKSHEGFVLIRDQENASIGLKLRFKLYRDATLTCVDQSLTVLAWSCTLNKSWSPCYVQQTLFLEQEPDQLGTKSNRGSKIESAAVFRLRIFLSLEFIVVAIGILRSRDFVKQSEQVPK